MLDVAALKSILESILFVSDKGVSVDNLAQLLEMEPEAIEKALKEIQTELESQNRGFQLRTVASKVSLFTNPANHQYVEQFLAASDFRRLTNAALETLAIIAYKQPATKSYISDIRGVNSDGSVATLLQKGLIKERGRAKSPGGPMLYGTGRKFLEQMNISSISDLQDLRDFAADEETKEQIKQSFVEQDSEAQTQS
ncbi:MAG: SMC-Scp complex subunit ScpB [Actinobacteria bacterium]|nr:MAG: SMC-Scp complex subunit ScpB [Actinomycetota bacterium]